MLDGGAIRVSPRATASLSILAGAPPPPPAFLITALDPGDARLRDYHRLRHTEFVERQGLFARTDRDGIDADPRTVVLVAVAPDGAVLGGVRLAPYRGDGLPDTDIGWWAGSRLVVASGHEVAGVGTALVRAACAHAERLGVLRFEATVQDRYARLFRGIGWTDHGPAPVLAGRPHRLMRWPLDPVQRVVEATKAVLASALAPFAEQRDGLGPSGFRGDDGVPIPGTGVVAACDAILPSMVERDPEWAGWCSVLVNLNDLTAMGALPVGLLDAVGAPTAAHLHRVIRGIADAARAWDVPVLGGHTQLGVPSALSVTAVGTAREPIRAGAGLVGDTVTVIADLGGGWRPGYHERQWDSTGHRGADELRRASGLLADLRPAAAKDVSMAGLVGTLGMLAEASGTGAELDIATVPRPAGASMGAWLTCFPGYAMLAADRGPVRGVPAPLAAAPCGRLTAAPKSEAKRS
ncbi:GNAT family N-acetyltransferase [Tsukamurella soli]|uniref:GNAT family N-acetyltransferase n=1 Tax=Tsukamurella soli TaxID=644556 RepID=A0ABP8JTU8_9ACTN